MTPNLPDNTRRLLEALQTLLAALPEDEVPALSTLSKQRQARLRNDIHAAMDRLQSLARALDPIVVPSYVLDPSDPKVLGRLIAQTLLEQPRHALREVPKFYGSGVYALYYTGPFDTYQPVSGSETPLYVGKADPKAPAAVTPAQQGTPLWIRLDDHRRSISAVNNLDVRDFECRYLVVTSAWQSTAELYLIDRFHPIWNKETGICYGIGKHGDDPGTRANTRSPWDTLHPGRPWASSEGNIPYAKNADEIRAQVVEHFRRWPPR